MRPKTSKQTKKKQNGLPKIAENHNPKTVIPIKTKKPDVRKPLTDKERVLLKACQTNDIDMVYLQYWDKVNLNCKDLVTGSTPLSTACQYGNQQIASLLIELGAKYDKVDEYGTSPLHYAANLENQKIAKTLVDKFSLSMADMNIQDDYGSTPLHFASARNNTHALKCGSNPCILNNDMKMPSEVTTDPEIKKTLVGSEDKFKEEREKGQARIDAAMLRKKKESAKGKKKVYGMPQTAPAPAKPVTINERGFGTKRPRTPATASRARTPAI